MDLLSRLRKSFLVEGNTRVAKLLIIAAAFIAVVAVLIAGEDVGQAQSGVIPRVLNPPLTSDMVNLPGDLRAIPVPTPPNLDEFVRDPAMARALGKALFWDMQVGSDGVQACASCHFRAGADPRSRNQLSPGLEAHAQRRPRILERHRSESSTRGLGLPTDPPRQSGSPRRARSRY